MEEQSKEIQAIQQALRAWYEKYRGEVVMNVSVMAFDEDGDAVEEDSHMWFAGVKQAQLSNCHEMMKDVIEEQFSSKELSEWLEFNSKYL